MLANAAFGTTIRLVAISILGCLCIFVLQHDSLTLRTLPWGARADCSIRLLSRDPGVPQTLLLGTSRTMQGVSGDVLAQELGQPVGSVINFGFNGRATDLQYLIAEDLAHRGRLERIVVELSVGSSASDRFLEQSRLAGEEIGTGASMLQSEAAMLFADRRQLADVTAALPIVSGVHERMQIVLRRLSATGHFGIRAMARVARLITMPAPSDDPNERSGCRQQSIRAVKLASPPTDQLDRSSDYFSRAATRVDRENYRRLVDLGRRHRLSVSFVRLPDRFSPIDNTQLVKATRNALGSDLMVPPASLVEQLRQEHFVDPMHVDRSGAALISR